MIWPHFNVRNRLGELDFESLTAVDLGCSHYQSTIGEQIAAIPFKKLTSIEGYKPDFDLIKGVQFASKEQRSRNEDVMSLDEDFDIGFAMDVIEHLPKETGEAFLDLLDKHIKIKMVIFCPVEPDGFHRPNPQEDNELQKHLSYWRPEDFTKRGYSVEVCDNIHSERDEQGNNVNFGALWAIKDYAKTL